MFVILTFAVVIHVLQGLIAADEIKAGMEAERQQSQQTQEAAPGTIR